MTTHELKTWPEPFTAVLAGRKLHEVRVNDRGFRVGDVLVLQEYDPLPTGMARGFTGRELRRVVTYMTHGGEWGMPPTLCVLSLGDAP